MSVQLDMRYRAARPDRLRRLRRGVRGLGRRAHQPAEPGLLPGARRDHRGILGEHEIVPVLQPVFFGFGWKGLGVAGPVVPAAEYARYCLYLVARYGAQHVVYLVGADGNGLEPQVEAGGREVHQWDCYQQPTGIHYRPHSTAEAQQDEPWLDFQWCQTGHEGEHVPERAALLWSRSPTKAAANGEPTYENGRRTGKASGWWQGHEAWASSAAPGACGSGRCDRTSPARNRTSSPLAAAGARRWTSRDLVTWAWLPASSTACRPRGLTVPGELHILYLEGRRRLRVTEAAVLPRFYAMIDPRTGNVHGQRECEPRQGGRRSFIETPDGPCVVVFTRRPLAWRELG